MLNRQNLHSKQNKIRQAQDRQIQKKYLQDTAARNQKKAEIPRMTISETQSRWYNTNQRGKNVIISEVVSGGGMPYMTTRLEYRD